jgi:hypothetical protein
VRPPRRFTDIAAGFRGAVAPLILKRMGSAKSFVLVLAIACASPAACGGSAPLLITPQEAQDRVYNHRSRAEAASMFGNRGAAREHRAAARRYQHLMEEGKTIAPEQALERGAWHRRRAEAYQETGYTRFVRAELRTAARYEDFALSSGGLTPEAAWRRALDYRQRADAYRRRGLDSFAEHYRSQASKLQSLADSRSHTALPSSPMP